MKIICTKEEQDLICRQFEYSDAILPTIDWEITDNEGVKEWKINGSTSR